MFETLKENLQKRIETDCVKVDVHGEEVILKKSRIPIVGDWGRIYPPIDEEGNINLLNFLFGGWKNFIRLLIILCVIGMFLYGFAQVTEGCRNMAENPCDYCYDYQQEHIGEPLLYQQKMDEAELQKEVQELGG